MQSKSPALIALLSLLITFFVVSCSEEGLDEHKGHDFFPIEFFDECVSHEFEIESLPYEELPRTEFPLRYAQDTSFPRDAEGVMLFEIDDQQYYHPVNMGGRCQILIDAYRRTDDSSYLSLAEKYARRLIAEAMEFEGALYYPYRFGYNVHSMDEARLDAPWFSGMAQGQMLGVLSRMFIATGDSLYLHAADQTFLSLQRLRDEAEPWVVFIDERGCFWIEEYPTATPSMTLNGFNTAVFGLYEYYQLTKNETAGEILQACLSTLKNYIPLFRRPGKVSLYGLTFRHYALNYHQLHIEQFRYLEKMTGDHFFGAWADTFYNDYHVIDTPASVTGAQ
jgi:hypothetical protein